MAAAGQGPRGDIRGPGPSPLQHFVQAKKKINEIFKEVDGYVSETETFLVSIPAETGVAQTEVQEAAKEMGKEFFFHFFNIHVFHLSIHKTVQT